MTARRRAVSIATSRRVCASWPVGLADLLLRCLDPDPKASRHGNDMARNLNCACSRRRKRCSPPAKTGDDSRGAFLYLVMLATVVPNAFAAVFNYYYNRRRSSITAGLSAGFLADQTTINSIAFPRGSLCDLVARPWQRQCVASGTTSPSPPTRSARCEKLPAARISQRVSLALWLIAAPGYPIALQMEVGSVPSAYIHFVASLTLCGLIAAAYPFFAVACLGVCSFYPALVSVESMSHGDLDPLLRLARSSWRYMLVAATVPMLSVAILVAIDSHARFAVGLMAAAGLAGFGLAFVLFRTLQSDLAALTLIATPPGEMHHTPGALSRSY